MKQADFKGMFESVLKVLLKKIEIYFIFCFKLIVFSVFILFWCADIKNDF